MNLMNKNENKMDILMKVLSLLMDHEFFYKMEKLNLNRKKDKLLNLILILDIFELIDEEKFDVDEQMNDDITFVK